MIRKILITFVWRINKWSKSFSHSISNFSNRKFIHSYVLFVNNWYVYSSKPSAPPSFPCKVASIYSIGMGTFFLARNCLINDQFNNRAFNDRPLINASILISRGKYAWRISAKAKPFDRSLRKIIDNQVKRNNIFVGFFYHLGTTIGYVK